MFEQEVDFIKAYEKMYARKETKVKK